MQPGFSGQPSRSFGIRDFLAFGKHYGIDYRFPGIPSPVGRDTDLTVARGNITETALPSGFRFTRSELDIFQSYESESLGHAPLLIVIVLEGRVSISVGAISRELEDGMAVSLQLCPEYALKAFQPAGQRLKTLTLAFDPVAAGRKGTVNPALSALLRNIQHPFHLWRMPAALIQPIEQSLVSPLAALQKKLLLEGLALQLAAYGLDGDDTGGPLRQGQLSPEQKRLESVRQLLAFAPTEHYTLEDLAQRAAMSSSGLRAKFRATYGTSVFDYLRQCRLELGRRHLEQGYTVQQAAHGSGYRYASNFATAFRRYFGVSPKGLT